MKYVKWVQKQTKQNIQLKIIEYNKSDQGLNNYIFTVIDIHLMRIIKILFAYCFGPLDS